MRPAGSVRNTCGCSGKSGWCRGREQANTACTLLDARGLRPVHEWTGGFERFWNESFDRLDAYVQDLKQERQEE